MKFSTPTCPPVIDDDADLVVVSNRLPIRYDERSCSWSRSPGGLVSALDSVLARHHGTWFGWNPTPRPIPRDRSHALRSVSLPVDAAHGYYAGFANRALWPALHGMPDRVEMHSGWWDAYVAANAAFADEVARHARPGALIWVHDYHLLLLPALLAERRPDLRVGLFLHTPVASAQVFAQLPHSDELLAGMAGAALVGTQRARDAVVLRQLLDGWARRHGAPMFTTVRAHPISVDTTMIAAAVLDPAVREQAQLERERVAGRRIVLSVDRVDYTKGILQRLDAFEKLLDLGLVSVDDVVLVQIAVPSRREVPAYRDLAARMKSRIRGINMRHRSPRGPAVVLVSGNLPFPDLASFYLAADTAMVTPLHDGMNLVAKEFAVARAGDPVALVLGVGAGASDELGTHAVLVDAADPLDLAAGLQEALLLEPADRVARSTALGRIVAAHDVGSWADGFLGELRAGSHSSTALAIA